MKNTKRLQQVLTERIAVIPYVENVIYSVTKILMILSSFFSLSLSTLVTDSVLIVLYR